MRGRRIEVPQQREALLVLTVERVRMVAVVGGLGVCLGVGVVMKVGREVQVMMELGVVGVVGMGGAGV